jgi:short-subunit dehydrogenase
MPLPHDHNVTVITGACGGIGKAFVMHFAREGHPLVLIDKSQEELNLLARWVWNNFHQHPYILPLDVTSQDALTHVGDFFRNRKLRIQWLVNNAGIGHTHLFETLDFHLLHQELEVNVQGTTLITHELLPFMQTDPPGHILFMSSLASFYPLPFKNAYGASKAYILQLARALRYELEQKGIRVSVCCPGFVNSTLEHFLQLQQLGWMERLIMLQPEKVVQDAVAGARKGRELIIPGRACRVLYKATQWMPSFVKQWITRHKFRSLRPLLNKPLVPV